MADDTSSLSFLRRCVVVVFGAKAAIQRCTLHYADLRIMPMWPQKLLCA
jgi:hypothetical protein